MKVTIVHLDMLKFFSNVTLGLNDEEALDAIESTFKQFNTFLDLMQEKGYVTMQCRTATCSSIVNPHVSNAHE